MTLGEQLKTLRQKTGFSQELVAERLGVSRQSVTKWERGQTVPTAENLLALARLYQVPLEALMTDRSARVEEGEDNPMLRENKTVIALSAQVGSLYAFAWGLWGLGRGAELWDLLSLGCGGLLFALCSMWTVWNLSFETDLSRRRHNMKLELRYLLVQAALAGVTAWLGLGLVGLAAGVGVLLFYLAVVNPRYMGRRLWWGRPRRKP